MQNPEPLTPYEKTTLAHALYVFRELIRAEDHTAKYASTSAATRDRDRYLRLITTTFMIEEKLLLADPAKPQQPKRLTLPARDPAHTPSYPKDRECPGCKSRMIEVMPDRSSRCLTCKRTWTDAAPV